MVHRHWWSRQVNTGYGIQVNMACSMEVMEEGREKCRGTCESSSQWQLWVILSEETGKSLNPGLSLVNNEKIENQFTELKSMA